MLKRIIIFSLIFSSIGSLEVNIEKKSRYGLLEVQAPYENNIEFEDV